MARASLEELFLDYTDFLRQRRLPEWPRTDSRRAELIARRPTTADEVAAWARDVKNRPSGRYGPSGQTKNLTTTPSTSSTPTYAEISANGAIALITVTCFLLDRQLAGLERSFVEEGGFTERLYRVRSQRRLK